MKRLMASLTALLALTLTTNAMSYEQAREQALFLTDKMAYELNLTEEQYDAAYEVNLDYLMSVNTPDDLYESYWRQRNIDLSYILLDWQYRAFCAATYFYRPLYWTDGLWHFAVYSRYPRRNYFYFGRPNIYITYRGGHGWRHNGGRSWYAGRTYHRGSHSKGHGLRDRFDRGDFRQNDKGGRGNGRYDRNEGGRNQRPQMSGSAVDNRRSNFNGNRQDLRSARQSTHQSRMRVSDTRPSTVDNRTGVRTSRESSTRTTVRQNSTRMRTGAAGSSLRSNAGTVQRKPSSTFTPSRSASRQSVGRSNVSSRSVGRSAPARQSSGRSGGSSRSGGSHGGKGSFGR